MTPDSWIAFAGLAIVLIGGLIDIRIQVSLIKTSITDLKEHREVAEHELRNHRDRIIVLEGRVNHGRMT